MKKLLLLALLLALLIALPLSLTACNKVVPGNILVLEVEDYGTIVLQLDPEAAPKTVAHFKQLVADDVLDGATFYRIVDDFVIQGGLVNNDDVPTVKGEFAGNGVDNPRKHVRGTLSMARTDDPDSGSSEFFICLAENGSTQYLDGKYAAFGYVIEGMDVVDAIAEAPTYSYPYHEYASITIRISDAYILEEYPPATEGEN